jgi:hypothetical protein
MKVHTTNYQNTFIAIADDCPNAHGEIPPVKGKDHSIANMQYDMISRQPYGYTSDEIIFHGYAVKSDFSPSELDKARTAFFSKGQPCLRCSPLAKRYGFGIHHDEEGKVAIYGAETPEYQALSTRSDLLHVKAMRTKRT